MYPVYWPAADLKGYEQATSAQPRNELKRTLINTRYSALVPQRKIPFEVKMFSGNKVSSS